MISSQAEANAASGWESGRGGEESIRGINTSIAASPNRIPVSGDIGCDVGTLSAQDKVKKIVIVPNSILTLDLHVVLFFVKPH